MSEVIMPTDIENWKELRSRDVTSTEASVLFGCNPYQTLFELWHRKKQAQVVNIDENERMRWGSRLEHSIAHGIAEDNGWEIRRMDEYIRVPEVRMGASFDYKIEGDKPAILEVKNVDSLAYRDGWIESDGDIEAPPHIEIQVQVQMAVSGLRIAYIGALVGGNRVILIERKANSNVQNSIMTKIDEFWKSIEDNNEPEPDFTRDAGFISELYGYSTPGKIMNLEGDELHLASALRYRELAGQIKVLEAERNEIKAEFLRKIGDAEKVIGGKYSISAGLIGPSHVEYERKGYRNFKINWKREKKNG